MKTMKPILLGAALTFASAYGAVAQSVSNVEATISVYMRDTPDFVAAAERTKAILAEQYPNVTINLRTTTSASWGSYISNLMNQVAAGDPPDILDMAIEGFLSVSSKDLLVDLRPILETEGMQTLIADIAPALLTNMASPITGELNFLPLEWNNIVIYYNKDLFDVAAVPYPQDGWTWDEFLATAKALTVTRDDGSVSQFGYRIPGSNFGITPWFLVNGTDKLNSDWTESNVTDPAFADTLGFLHSLIHEHKVSPAFEAGTGDQEFAAGQVAMFSCGHWCVPGIQAAGLKNVGVVMIPVPDAEDEQVTIFGIGGIGVMKSSEHPEIALEFVRIFAGEDFQRDVATNFFGIPASRTWANTAEYLSFPDNAELFYQTAEAGQIIPISSPPNFAQVEDIFLRHLGSYLNDNVELSVVIDDLESELSRAMARANR